MSASYNTSWNGTRHPHYYCRGKGCRYVWKTIKKTDFEIQFETLLSKVKPADGLVDLTKDILQEQWSFRLKQHAESRSRATMEVDEADSAIKSYLERIRKTKNEDLIATYEDEIKELKRKKKQVEIDLGKRKYTNEEFGTASEKVFNTLKNPMSMWKSDEYDDKRTIFFMYFEDQLRYDYKEGFGTAGLAYPVKLISQIGQAQNRSVEMSMSDIESE